MLNTVLELEILAEWHMTKCIHLLKTWASWCGFESLGGVTVRDYIIRTIACIVTIIDYNETIICTNYWYYCNVYQLYCI